MTAITKPAGGLTTRRPERASLSLRDAAKQSLSRTTSKAIVIVDCSGSMETRDALGGKRRIDALREILESLRAQHQFQMIVFGTDAVFASVIREPSGSTMLHLAIDLAANVTGKDSTVILISDGEPDSEALAFQSAARLKAKIQCFFVGQPGGAGEDFLRRLASATGGNFASTPLGTPKSIESKIKYLLEAK